MGRDWQLLWLAFALLFSRPPRHRIPILPIRFSLRAMPVEAARPTWSTWGLSVLETLHLVGDNKKGYKIFGTTLMKFPGRKPCRRCRLGVS
jgi:hypothetical protein